VNSSSVAAGAVMIYPKSFCANPDTLATNSFQSQDHPLTNTVILEKSQKEFSAFQKLLKDHGIKILSFEEDVSRFTPDALFPNNWFCHLPDGRIFLFPMFPLNRRSECRQDIIRSLNSTNVTDLRYLEKQNQFLEGTGSLIFDHQSKTAFACLSPRTTEPALREFSEVSGYKIVTFTSLDTQDKPVYHTNVMMSLSPQNAVICLESVKNSEERDRVMRVLKSLKKNIVDITCKEMNSFAGNMLFLKGGAQYYWVCSTRAFHSLKPLNRSKLETEAAFLHSPLDTIETYGGGGARCLLAEYFDF
jgi:hypothetical protein